MSIQAAIYTQLTGHAGVAAEVGTRVYPEIAPASAALPRITYTVISGTHARHLAGASTGGTSNASGVAFRDMQLDVWASTSVERDTVGEAVRDALDGIKGTMSGEEFQFLHLDGESDSWEPPTDASQVNGIFRRRMDFSLAHVESVPDHA